MTNNKLKTSKELTGYKTNLIKQLTSARLI